MDDHFRPGFHLAEIESSVLVTTSSSQHACREWRNKGCWESLAFLQGEYVHGRGQDADSAGYLLSTFSSVFCPWASDSARRSWLPGTTDSHAPWLQLERQRRIRVLRERTGYASLAPSCMAMPWYQLFFSPYSQGSCWTALSCSCSSLGLNRLSFSSCLQELWSVSHVQSLELSNHFGCLLRQPFCKALFNKPLAWAIPFLWVFWLGLHSFSFI